MIDAVLLSHGAFAYILVFALLLAGSFGLPVPEDVALITAGVLVSSGRTNLLIMAAVCYVGIIVGDVIIYRVGWMAGPSILRRRWARKYFTVSRMRSLRRNIEKRTFWTILVARHLFYLRTATFLFCGVVRISFTRFLVADAIAALITLPIMLGTGYLVGEHYRDALVFIEKIKHGLGLLGILLLIFLYLRYRKASASL